MSREVNILIKKKLPPHNVGDEVKIPVDEGGIPLDKYWRRRLRDSKIDNCIEIKEKRDESRAKK